MECTTTSNSNEDLCDSNDKSDLDDSKEAEGVWSSDIEKSFNEALTLYPPCGRRKIVLSEEGKMYGRNELIARYIKMQTGKSRSRKQVSSHIQVLARRKSKDIQSHIQEKHTREHARQHLSHMSSAQIVSDFKLSDNLSLGLNGHKLSKFIDQNTKNFTYPLSLSPRYSSSTHPSTKSQQNSCFMPRQATLPPSLSRLNTNHNTLLPYLSIDSSSPPPPPPPLTSDLHSHNYPLSHNLWTMPRPAHLSPQSDPSVGPHHVIVDRDIASEKIRLLELSAFLETEEYPAKIEKHYSMTKWRKHLFAHINANKIDPGPPYFESIDISQISDKYPETDGLKEFFERGPHNAFFMVKFWIDISVKVFPQFNQAWSITLEGVEDVNIKLSTKLCSFGKQVLDRIEEKSPIFENGTFIYRFENDMCDYMRKFIVKLSCLEERSMMNSVLENFTILQTVFNAFTGEILLCIAFAMEVSVVERGSQYHIYKLISHTNLRSPDNF